MVPASIVVPLDGSHFAERAIPVASALGAALPAQLVLMSTRWGDDAQVPQEYLERLAGAHAGSRPDVTVILDRPGPEAIDMFASDPDRIVCMTTHGRGRLRWAALGSTAEHVVRHARHPVVLVGRHCSPDWPGRLERVLLCSDGAATDDPAVPVAAEWASTLGLAAQVLYVAHPLDTSPDRPPATVDRVVATLRREGVDTSAICRVNSYVPGAIADDVAETPGTLVVMASHARTGVARVALGSVAMGTIALSQCPVVVTRGNNGPRGPA